MMFLSLMLTAFIHAAPAPPVRLDLDHVSLFVDSVAKASNDLQALGFNVKSYGRFPKAGIENSGIRFDNGTYLEILGIFDRSKPAAADSVKFLKTGEGCDGFGIVADSAQHIYSVLLGNKQDVELTTESNYQSPGAPRAAGGWQWKDVLWKKGSPPGTPFFVEYARPRRHDAAKTGIVAVVLAVTDLS